MHSDLNKHLEKAMQNGQSFVAWRLPFQQKVEQLGPAPESVWSGEPGKGFVFAPFDTADYPRLSIGMGAPLTETVTLPLIQPKAKEAFIAYGQRSVEAIRQRHFDKIVNARVITLNHPNFNPIDHFTKLCHRYPSAFCYVWFSPSSGLWLGASPELLLEKEGLHLKTMALAGPRVKNTEGFGSKEMEEQHLVLDYLVSELEKIGATCEVSEKVQGESGHLTHLKNEISAHLRQDKTPFDLANILAPTPAVAGLPKDKAMKWIAEFEGNPRHYYAGYLGEISGENANLFVNLRCMRAEGDTLYVYVGAGLTADSDPELEWIETEEKAKVVLMRD
ncbi:MAG: chorismate-binding protein [Bacteroidota bacterium]|nr:chorismate-binding protein [Bacteroidota bacterium]MDX5430778.1 chorismate-binding protein [Bacteroidota bacterium]MDX5469523.1 chorismate-binding protein [Bacteroidota bacterium]